MEGGIHRIGGGDGPERLEGGVIHREREHNDDRIQIFDDQGHSHSEDDQEQSPSRDAHISISNRVAALGTIFEGHQDDLEIGRSIDSVSAAHENQKNSIEGLSELWSTCVYEQPSLQGRSPLQGGAPLQGRPPLQGGQILSQERHGNIQQVLLSPQMILREQQHWHVHVQQRAIHEEIDLCDDRMSELSYLSRSDNGDLGSF